MGDPRFERTVILIVQHDPSGALGIVINKPIGEPSIASVFEALGQNGGEISGTVRVFSGGPVQPEMGFVVHSADYRRPETVAVNDRLSMTSRVDIRPKQALIIAGGLASFEAAPNLDGNAEYRVTCGPYQKSAASRADLGDRRARPKPRRLEAVGAAPDTGRSPQRCRAAATFPAHRSGLATHGFSVDASGGRHSAMR
jgi:hypothetical protein